MTTLITAFLFISGDDELWLDEIDVDSETKSTKRTTESFTLSPNKIGSHYVEYEKKIG